jgi:hypothetical protein
MRYDFAYVQAARPRSHQERAEAMVAYILSLFRRSR